MIFATKACLYTPSLCHLQTDLKSPAKNVSLPSTKTKASLLGQKHAWESSHEGEQERALTCSDSPNTSRAMTFSFLLGDALVVAKNLILKNKS